MDTAAPAGMAIIEELSKRTVWEIRGFQIRFDTKLSLRQSLAAKVRLVRLFGPSLSALAAGQEGQKGIVAEIVKAASEKYVKGGGSSPALREEIEAEMLTKAAADLGDYMAKNFAEALDRLVVSLSDAKAEADLWFLLEIFAKQAWATAPGKNYEKALSEVIETLFAGRWDVVWRFLGAAVIREYGTFLAELVPIDRLRLVAPGLFPSGSPDGSTTSPTPSPTASPPPGSTPTAGPTS